ncbi:MAG: DUF349 domain-containing protein [Actinomycetaceae bacterium]|nr:DUF349 domain-containing protein [Arcanobacterium sp.]MDD7686418.1 DUF349 domain-containing protein [Actinomycetaceae bacterium]MDY5272698.1 DUF349 domain-containing protein [Arcanobacterium sp.]
MTEAQPSRPMPHPIPKPQQVAQPSAVLSQPQPAIDETAAAEAAAWGRVDNDGNVWLRSSGDAPERIVGQYAAGGTEKDALMIYVRRFLDLRAQVSLLESRMATISPEEAKKSLHALHEQLVEPAVIGDVASLRERADALDARLAQREVEVAEQRAEAKEKALAERTSIVEEAEAICAQDPATTHWRDSHQKFVQLLDQWKYAQRHGARLDRTAEEALWKRFSSARTQFDRHRRQHFSELEAQHKATIARKEAIIAEAEKIQNSTDWGATSATYRQLMEEWKRAGRSTKRDDDKLWARFRAAQQVFFDARNAHNASIDEEYAANLAAKLALLEKAEALLPITDVAQAKEAIRAIGEEWDAIGRVPRADVNRTEGRMRDIERAIRDADQAEWQKSDPDKEERSNGMAAQLEALIAELEEQIAQAMAAGETSKVHEFEEALAARQAWLAEVLKD